jgi:hypothetical protein
VADLEALEVEDLVASEAVASEAVNLVVHNKSEYVTTEI